jgi:probable phosphoglycerate mutase
MTTPTLEEDQCTLYLIRHGDCRRDEIKRYIGQVDLPLNAEGRAQARALRKHLAETPFRRIYASDLKRCQETARIITGQQGQSIRSQPLLREIKLGYWDGRPQAKIRQYHPEEYRQRGENLIDVRPPGGESFADLQARVVPAFRELIDREQGSVLLIAHAGVNRAILCNLLGHPLDELFTLPQPFGCLNIIERRGTVLEVKAINLPVAPHLYDLADRLTNYPGRSQ